MSRVYVDLKQLDRNLYLDYLNIQSEVPIFVYNHCYLVTKCLRQAKEMYGVDYFVYLLLRGNNYVCSCIASTSKLTDTQLENKVISIKEQLLTQNGESISQYLEYLEYSKSIIDRLFNFND